MDAPGDDAYLWVSTGGGAAGGTLEVRGEIDAGSAAQLVTAVDALTATGSDVVLDLEQVSFIDSSGIRAIAETVRRAGDEGFSVRITAASDVVRRLLEMTGMAGLIDG